MKNRTLILLAFLVMAGNVLASERHFTYSYEPETMPAGAAEVEQTTTWRGLRSNDVGQENYSKFELRESFEYGVTDRYTAELYFNSAAESYRNPTTHATESAFDFEGLSLENRYMVLNPVEHAVGLTLYCEGTYSGTAAGIEEKIIFGQRHGDWKWVLNISHETEWALNDRQTEGEFEVTFGITRQLSPRWSVGVEFRNRNEIPEYNNWENTAFYLGPVVSYSRDKWWAALTIMPQIWGRGTSGGRDVDGLNGLELEGNERVNVRLIFGIAID